MSGLSFAERLIAWQRSHGRHGLPWQNTRDPYRVWLSEIMLQQTQVNAVIPYYLRFLDRFSDMLALSAAPIEEVMSLWSGLGYYARARNLHACARLVVDRYQGRFPDDAETIASLPGIGTSTANAIAVFCFGARLPILDGNVKRLLARYAGIEGWPGIPAIERHAWQLAARLLPTAEVDTYIQAQMDLGASICTRSKPACARCPVADDCVAHRDGRTSQLPTPKPRQAVPERTTTMLVLMCDRRVLLLPRPPTGIWGGLLSFPEISGADDAVAAAARLGCVIHDSRMLAPVTHTFTHFRLKMHPLVCEAEAGRSTAETGGRWLAAGDLAQAPLPAPVRRLLAVLLDQPVV